MERIYLKDKQGIESVREFLSHHDLILDEHIDELYVIKENDKIIGSGAIHGCVLKCIAVDSNYQGTSIINRLMGYLINRAYELGQINLFIYTKPSSRESFEYFGFKKIAETENVVLLENKINGMNDYQAILKRKHKTGRIGSVVVNCNPFTNGHLHLIETASKACDHVHVFVVWEDESTFPNHIRYELIQKGIKHLKNIILHQGEDYIISQATFPSYFLRNDLDIVIEQTTLDINLFAMKIVPCLDIEARFIGKEPFNETTRTYNEVMKQELPKYGVEVVEIERMENLEEAISASRVRRLISIGDYDSLKVLVPKSTYDFLLSEVAKPIIKKIQMNFNIRNLV